MQIAGVPVTRDTDNLCTGGATPTFFFWGGGKSTARAIDYIIFDTRQ